MAKASKPSVFISYARRDGLELAQRLLDDLTAKRFNVWLDTQRIQGGASWTVEIERAIDRAQVVLVLLTRGSYISDICRAEQLRSLRKRKRVIPVLAQNGADVPLHLEAKNYRDFTGSKAYAAQLRLLLDDIRTGNGAVKLRPAFRSTHVTAPPLPRNYIERPEALAKLRDRVLTEEPGPSIALTALRGMGGIGKTILAQALSHDGAVQQAFPDGIVWTTVGKEPAYSLVTRMQEVRRALGDEPAESDSELHCVNRYRTLLREKATLVIIDDVWRSADIEPFLAEAPRSRVLFTTRDDSIAVATGAMEHRAELLTMEQSRELLARWAGLADESLPPESVDVVGECGQLPLALSMIGAMLHGKPAFYWNHVLKLLQAADLKRIAAQFPGYPHEDLLRVMQVSVDALDALDRARYLALAVLLEDMPAAPAVQQALWNIDEGEALETAERFMGLSLAWRDSGTGGIRLHDLQLDYVRAQYADRKALDVIRGAVRLSSHVIDRDSMQFASQVVGRLLPYRDEVAMAQFIGGVTAGAPRPWIRPIQPALHPPGTALTRTLEGHAGWVTGVAMSPDGRRAVSASGDKTLKVWNLDTGQLLLTLEGHAASVNGVGVSPDGRQAVSASEDHTLKVWDLDTGKVLRTLKGHTRWINGVAVSRDGRRAVSASEDHTLKVWDLDTWRMLDTLEGHSRGVVAVAVSPDGRRAASASEDLTLKVWDLDTGKIVASLEGHAAAVYGVAWSPDGRHVVSASEDQTLKLWDVDTRQMLRTLEGHTASIEGVAVTRDGQQAVSASGDQTLRVWDLETGQMVRTLEGHSRRVIGVATSSDGRRAVSASEDKTLKVWDLEAGQIVRPLESHADWVSGVAVSRDGRRAVSASQDKTLKVWNLETGVTVRKLEDHARGVSGVAVSPDGRRAVSASRDQTLKVWDLDTGEMVRTLKGHARGVSGVALSPDGRQAVSASRDHTLKVWNLDTGEMVRPLEGHADRVNGVAVSPDGGRAVSASQDQTLKVWNLDTGQMLRTLEGHARWVNSVTVSPDGRWAVSASADQTLKVWDLDTGQMLRTLEGHAGWVRGVAVSPDGRLAMAASEDKTLKVWNLNTGSAVGTFTCDGAAYCCAFVSNSKLIAGDVLGRVHFLSIEQ